MKNILIPTDFSTCANNAVNFVVQSAKYLPLEASILHSFEQTESTYTNYVGLDKEYSRILLNDVKEKMNQLKSSINDADKVQVQTYISDEGLDDAIETLNKEKNIDLIVMGTLGATGIREIFWGSRTASLIDKSSIPILVIPFDYDWQKPLKFCLATNQFEESSTTLDFLFEMVTLYGAKLEILTFTNQAIPSSEMDEKLHDYESKLEKAYGINSIATTHLYGEAFEEALQHHIKENNVDILAMITYHKNKSFFYRLFNSSRTKRMSYHTEIPLLVLPGQHQ